MSTRFRPGGTAWLLVHEIRMFYFELGAGMGRSGRARRGLGLRALAWLVLALLVLHGVAWALMHKLPPLGGTPGPLLSMVAGGFLLLCFTFMLSLALKSCVSALFERSDLDLLLSSPLSSQAIFSVRLAAICVGVAAMFLLFLAPFANVGLYLGQPRWLGIYPAVLALAVIASAAAMAITLALVRLIGVRKTRVLAQILGAVTGAAFFLLTQYNNLTHQAPALRYARLVPLFADGAVLGPQSWLWLPGRALLGAPGAEAALAVLAAAAFFVIAHQTHTFFVRGVQQSNGMGRARPAPARRAPLRFHGGLLRITLFKEWRLIARDPQLISQILLQLLYLAPLYFLFLGRQTQVWVTGVGASLTFLVASLAGSLSWVTVAAEDAPDLLRAAPVRPALLELGKAVAALLPVLALALPFWLWTLSQQVPVGLVLIFCNCGAAAGAVMIVLWTSVAGKRGAFKTRSRGNWLASLLEVFNCLLWAAGSYMALASVVKPAQTVPDWPYLQLAGLALGAAMTILFLVYSFKRKRV